MIDYESLRNSIIDQLDESIIEEYDFDTVLKSAEPCWDDTAIRVKSKDFTMIFDNVNYELLQYTGFDII